jgi:acyl-CoA thioesterase FadM
VKLFFRLLHAFLAVRFRAPCSALGPCRTRFRVWPGDIDVLFHVNNGVYLSMLDIARVDMMLRSGALRRLRARRFYPVVAAQTIRYRRSLRLFERFEVETRVVGWDEQAFLITHAFLRGDEVVAEAVVRVRFLAQGGKKPPSAEVLELLDMSGPSPVLPESIAVWNESQKARAGGSQPPSF